MLSWLIPCCSFQNLGEDFGSWLCSIYQIPSRSMRNKNYLKAEELQQWLTLYNLQHLANATLSMFFFFLSSPVHRVSPHTVMIHGAALTNRVDSWSLESVLLGEKWWTSKSTLYIVSVCMSCLGHCNVLSRVYGVYVGSVCWYAAGHGRYVPPPNPPSSWDNPP